MKGLSVEKNKTLLICGSRKLTRVNFKKFGLDEIFSDYSIGSVMTGGAIGVDTHALRYADSRGLKTIEIKPDYSKYGGKAPLIRDVEMIGLCDYCVGFWDGVSNGTKYTMDRAHKEGKLICCWVLLENGIEYKVNVL